VTSAADTGPTRPWVVLQHVEHEGPGTIAGVLTTAGIEWRTVRLDRGDPLPAVGDLSGLVVMGGPMGVHDEDQHPWLAPERDLLGAVASAGLPVLGICLGAQQMAAALGAEVTTGVKPEVGAGHITLTDAGRRDPVFGPEYRGLSGITVPCVHWHQDTFTLPEGAIHLAATRTTPHQAFRIGPAAYGLQFHIEIDTDLATQWRPRLPDGVGLTDVEVAAVASAGRRILGRFVDVSIAAGRYST